MAKLMVLMIFVTVLASFSDAFGAKNDAAQERPLSALCRLTEEGEVAGQWKPIRVEVAGQAVAGADDVSDAVETLKNLQASAACQIHTQECGLSGEGVIAGQWQKHRIFVDGVAVAGARDLSSLSAKLGQLQDSGVCN